MGSDGDLEIHDRQPKGTEPYLSARLESGGNAPYYSVRAADRSIVLIGFMGTGKSSVGRRLAHVTGWPRFDTDQMIATALGMSITKIFAKLGEEDFREEETIVLNELDPDKLSIIVTGGGVVLRPKNVARLHELGIVVCLTANLPTLLKRLARRSHRPLLEAEDRSATVKSLLRERQPLYEKAADLTIDTSSLSHDQVAQSIQDSLALTY